MPSSQPNTPPPIRYPEPAPTSIFDCIFVCVDWLLMFCDFEWVSGLNPACKCTGEAEQEGNSLLHSCNHIYPLRLCANADFQLTCKLNVQIPAGGRVIWRKSAGAARASPECPFHCILTQQSFDLCGEAQLVISHFVVAVIVVSYFINQSSMVEWFPIELLYFTCLWHFTWVSKIILD